MKVILIALAAVCAKRLSGVDEKKMMSGAHWRKPWPEGHTDLGETEAEANVLDQFNTPAVPDRFNKKYQARERYPWEYDSDVLHTGRSIEQAEGMIGGKLTHDAVKEHKGLNWIFEANIGHNFGRSRYERSDTAPE